MCALTSFATGFIALQITRHGHPSSGNFSTHFVATILTNLVLGYLMASSSIYRLKRTLASMWSWYMLRTTWDSWLASVTCLTYQSQVTSKTAPKVLYLACSIISALLLAQYSLMNQSSNSSSQSSSGTTSSASFSCYRCSCTLICSSARVSFFSRGRQFPSFTWMSNHSVVTPVAINNYYPLYRYTLVNHTKLFGNSNSLASSLKRCCQMSVARLQMTEACSSQRMFQSRSYCTKSFFISMPILSYCSLRTPSNLDPVTTNPSKSRCYIASSQIISPQFSELCYTTFLVTSSSSQSSSYSPTLKKVTPFYETCQGKGSPLRSKQGRQKSASLMKLSYTALHKADQYSLTSALEVRLQQSLYQYALQPDKDTLLMNDIINRFLLIRGGVVDPALYLLQF